MLSIYLHYVVVRMIFRMSKLKLYHNTKYGLTSYHMLPLQMQTSPKGLYFQRTRIASWFKA
jgi:hypothetical protein